VQRRWRIGALVGGLAVVAAAFLPLCRSRGSGAADRLATSIAAGAAAAVEASRSLIAPRRCAELAQAGRAQEEADGGLEVLEVSAAAEGRAVIGLVADARSGGEAATQAQLATIAGRFATAKVDLVVSLGGMAEDEDGIAAALEAVATGPWPVLAIPGDREGIESHRRAIARLSAAGKRVVDGSRVRLARVGGAFIATYPGSASAARMASADGCVHGGEDAASLARVLAGRGPVRIVASHAPPRGVDAAASDLGSGGVHVGEASLAKGARDAGAQLVVHGVLDEAVLGEAAGVARLRGGEPLALGVGAAEPAPVGPMVGGRTASGGALIVTIDGTTARWERVVIRSGDARR
jgi:hypothetical protein